MSKWRPIETAPRDKRVMVYGKSAGGRHPFSMIACNYSAFTLAVADGFQDEDWAQEGPDGDFYMPPGWYEDFVGDDAPAHNIVPTHWMPLPPPPEEGK